MLVAYGTVSPLFLMTAFNLSGTEPMRFCRVVKEIDQQDDVRVPPESAALGWNKIIFDKLSFPEWWGAGVVICLERGADLHTAQLMPLPLTVSCFSKIQIGFYVSGTGSPG